MSTEEDREALCRVMDASDPEMGGVVADEGHESWEWYIPMAEAILAAGFHRTPAPVQGDAKLSENSVGRQVRYDDGEWSREVEVVPAPQVTDEMVERAAYGMYLVRPIELGQGGQDDWAILPDEWKHEWREAACAALEAALGVKP